MAVGEEYIWKLHRAVRLKTPTVDSTAELMDLVEECRADLIRLGVLPDKANDEADPLILGAVRCFIRWKWAQTPEDETGNMRDYMLMRDELRKTASYTEAVAT
jgi:hypothetical protein